MKKMLLFLTTILAFAINADAQTVVRIYHNNPGATAVCNVYAYVNELNPAPLCNPINSYGGSASGIPPGNYEDITIPTTGANVEVHITNIWNSGIDVPPVYSDALCGSSTASNTGLWCVQSTVTPTPPLVYVTANVQILPSVTPGIDWEVFVN